MIVLDDNLVEEKTQFEGLLQDTIQVDDMYKSDAVKRIGEKLTYLKVSL